MCRKGKDIQFYVKLNALNKKVNLPNMSSEVSSELNSTCSSRPLTVK